MNEEEGFHLLLDQNPEDNTTRLIFADWLQDRDDKRAEGYRQLVKLNKHPIVELLPIMNSKKEIRGFLWRYSKYDLHTPICTIEKNIWLLLANYSLKSHNRIYYRRRRDAENAFATAWYLHNNKIKY